MEARDLRRIARENLEGNWALSVGVALVASLLGGLMAIGGSGFNINVSEETIAAMPEFMVGIVTALASVAGIMSFVTFIVGGTIQLGYARYLLKQYGKAPNLSVSDLFSQFHRFGQGFAQAFLRNLYSFLWGLLFIIPGIVKTYAYAMTPFIMAENPDMTANEAITASKELMDGHKGELFWLDLTFIGWSLLCTLTLGIGNLFLNPYMNAAYAAFYRDISRPRREPIPSQAGPEI